MESYTEVCEVFRCSADVACVGVDHFSFSRGHPSLQVWKTNKLTKSGFNFSGSFLKYVYISFLSEGLKHQLCTKTNKNVQQQKI